MLAVLSLVLLCALFAGLACVAVRQRDEARRDARRNERLARIGACVEGLAHDLNNVFTSIPYFIEEMVELDDVERRGVARLDLETTLDAGSKFLQELQRYSAGHSDCAGSLEGVVRLAVAGLRYRGPKIVTRIVADVPYGPGELETLERVRQLLAAAVETASALERAVVDVELNGDGLVIEHPAHLPSATGPAPEASVDTVSVTRWEGWSVLRRVRRRDERVLDVRLEITPTRLHAAPQDT